MDQTDAAAFKYRAVSPVSMCHSECCASTCIDSSTHFCIRDRSQLRGGAGVQVPHGRSGETCAPYVPQTCHGSCCAPALNSTTTGYDMIGRCINSNGPNQQVLQEYCKDGVATPLGEVGAECGDDQHCFRGGSCCRDGSTAASSTGRCYNGQLSFCRTGEVTVGKLADGAACFANGECSKGACCSASSSKTLPELVQGECFDPSSEGPQYCALGSDESAALVDKAPPNGACTKHEERNFGWGRSTSHCLGGGSACCVPSGGSQGLCVDPSNQQGPYCSDAGEVVRGDKAELGESCSSDLGCVTSGSPDVVCCKDPQSPTGVCYDNHNGPNSCDEDGQVAPKKRDGEVCESRIACLGGLCCKAQSSWEEYAQEGICTCACCDDSLAPRRRCALAHSTRALLWRQRRLSVIPRPLTYSLFVSMRFPCRLGPRRFDAYWESASLRLRDRRRLAAQRGRGAVRS